MGLEFGRNWMMAALDKEIWLPKVTREGWATNPFADKLYRRTVQKYLPAIPHFTYP